MKHIISRRYWWFALSALLILPGLYFLLLHPQGELLDRRRIPGKHLQAQELQSRY